MEDIVALLDCMEEFELSDEDEKPRGMSLPIVCMTDAGK